MYHGVVQTCSSCFSHEQWIALTWCTKKNQSSQSYDHCGAALLLLYWSSLAQIGGIQPSQGDEGLTSRNQWLAEM